MALDAPTILTITLAMTATVAAYLAAEWRAVRDRALLYWSGGFAAIAIGCALAPLRQDMLSLVGIWCADGLLILAHLLFLLGVARFTSQRVSPIWYAILAPWAALLAMPAGPSMTLAYGTINALLVAILSLRAAALLAPRIGPSVAEADQLRLVLSGHGLFYIVKALLVSVPGAFADIVHFQGALILASLVEGVVAVVLIALAMIGSVRRRREQQIELLAESDPLTGLFNRRAFSSRAPHLLKRAAECGRGALILLDVDYFKQVNDRQGHDAGDRLLIALAKLLGSIMPESALIARLGGDEFAVLLDCGQKADITRLCNDLRLRFHEAALREADDAAPATLSIGGVLLDPRPGTLADLLACADTSLYQAKRGGRNRLQLWDGRGTIRAASHADLRERPASLVPAGLQAA